MCILNLKLGQWAYTGGSSTPYEEHHFFLSALSTTSDSLTRRQRKALPSHGRRVKAGHVTPKLSFTKHLEK